MSCVKVKALSREFPDLKISLDRSYKELTSLGIGKAPLPILLEVDNSLQLQDLLKYLHHKNVPCFIFGAGTNLVGMDTPYNGVGLRLSGKEFCHVEIDQSDVHCGAYTKLPVLASLCAKAGLGGFSPLSGIPGSVGGALKMNAGANGTEIGSLVKKLSGFYLNGKKWSVDAGDIQWCYRGNDLPHDVIITEAVFSLQKSDSEIEEDAIAAEADKRRKREPSGRTAGCAFRNVSDLDPAGKLIDQCGLRGLKVGDLMVSEKHANYLINTGNASAADYLQMIRILRRAVSEKHGFYLTSEIVTMDPALAKDIEKDTPSPYINVLYGGVSSEREVSLKSGDAVSRALRRGGFKVELSDIRSCTVTDTMRNADVVYPVLHGGFGEGGELQDKLEKAKLRFVGSGSKSSELVMDKILTKKLLDRLSLPTAPWGTVSRRNRNFPEHLHFPVMLKAPCEGSTVGIIKVSSPDEWDNALNAEFKFADELLVEEFLPGREITVPVINASALDAVEIVSPSGFYDWDAKYVYNNGKTEYFCPPKSVSPEVTALAKEYALKFYHAAGCRDILRVDFIVGDDDVPRILEGNSLPGNTDHSLVPKAARQAGISMEKMTATLVYAAMKRSGETPGTEPAVKKNKFFSLVKWLFNFIINIAMFCCGAIFAYAGFKYTHLSLPTVILSGGGVLLIFMALIRQFDRR